MRIGRLVLVMAAVLGCCLARAQDDSWKQALGDPRELLADLREEVVQIPLRDATPQERAFPLTATLFQPPGAGPFPVVILNHGSPSRARDRDVMGRWRLVPQVREIVGWGAAVLVPMRRGYGASPGDFSEGSGSCERGPDYARALRESARDVLSAVDFVRTRPTLDARRIVLMGQSAGGAAALAAASQSPAGVIGLVNLAGGRGGNGRDGKPCAPDRMAQLLSDYGSATRVPAL
jgi:dienelactone hydrolase